MLRVIVLGSAAGGGVPQWNCGCAVCDAARSEEYVARAPALHRLQLSATQCSLAISVDDVNWLLVNASPDLRQQIAQTPALWPETRTRHTPISAVVLTNGEIDAIAGLLSMREGAPFTIYAHEQVLGILAGNSIFGVLPEARVPRIPMVPGVPFAPVGADGATFGLTVTAFTVPGKPALYLETAGAGSEGDTLGLDIRSDNGNGRVLVVTACAAMTPELQAILQGAPLVFFDGTVWRDDELIAAGLADKTAQRMGHMAMSGPGGVMAALEESGIRRKVFLHVNNSNPALLPDTVEHAELKRRGWLLARDGMEFRL